MRSAGNFHPEWGYLAPAPSFMRMVRTALVATAIGAVAGAVVVVSLIERPGSNDSAIAAHALLTRAPVIASPTVVSRAAAPVAVKSAPPAAQPQAQLSMATPARQPPLFRQQRRRSRKMPPSPISEAARAASVRRCLCPRPRMRRWLRMTRSWIRCACRQKLTSPLRRIRLPSHACRRKDPHPKGGATTPTATNPIGDRKPPENRWHDNGGFAPLFRLFSSRSGSPYSSN